MNGELASTSSCPPVTMLGRNGTQEILRLSGSLSDHVIVHDMATHSTTFLEYPLPAGFDGHSWSLNGTVLGNRLLWLRGTKLFATPLAEILQPLPR